MEKKILPKATKTSLIKLLRARGYEIASLYQASFERHGHAYWLCWQDRKNVLHRAYYSTAAGRPFLQIDKQWVNLTMAEVIQFGLYEEK